MHDNEQSFNLPAPELEPITFELANGHMVKMEARLWPRRRTYEEWAAGIWPEPYFGIRIYCTENSIPKRLLWCEEFREGLDFEITCIHEIWQWLGEFVASRAIFEFDSFEDFLHLAGEALVEISTLEPDAIGHYEQLPGLTEPESFDRVDDSVFNDQNDSERKDADPLL